MFKDLAFSRSKQWEKVADRPDEGIFSETRR